MKGNCQKTCSDYFQACIIISKYTMSVVMVFCLEHIGSIVLKTTVNSQTLIILGYRCYYYYLAFINLGASHVKLQLQIKNLTEGPNWSFSFFLSLSSCSLLFNSIAFY